MKTKLSLALLILALSPVPYVLSQVPQGFNYQAIARDGAGAILDNKTFNIELTVQTSTGTEMWKELKPVTSNQFGLVTAVLGTGTNLVGGGVASFSMIDWKAQPLYLKTRVQYPGTTWNVMGTSQLWSVPYSLVARDLEGPVSKLGIEGTTTNSEESLFEVKNKNGEIVFAVYNEGVRVYVPDGAKGPKGGFAVSGWGYNKAVPENYLFVGPDSIRAYIWDDPLVKGAKGGFTVSGYNSAKKITNNYLTVTPDSVAVLVDDVPNTKGAKGGFTVSGFNTAKAGELQNLLRVNDEYVSVYIDDTGLKGAKGGFTVSGFSGLKAGTDPYKYLNVTHDSTRVFVSNQAATGSLGGFAVKPVESLGLKTEFFNISSSANAEVIKNEKRVMWYPTRSALLAGEVHVGSADSVGLNSTALGYRSIAKGNQSQAFGYRSIAYGQYSTAIGYQAQANNNSMAVGYKAEASGNDSYAFGSASKASGVRSFAFGSVGLDSLGNPTSQQTLASGDYSMALGLGAQALTLGSVSMGVSSKASGNQSVAVGFESKSLDKFSTAVGYRSEANGYGALSVGSQISASVAAGPPTYSMYLLTSRNIATGGFSTAIGSGNYSSSGGITLGSANNATAFGALAAGFFNKALGQKSTALGYFNEATGDLSTVMGTRNTAQSYASLTIGQWSNLAGSTTAWVDTDPLFVAGNGKVVYSGGWVIQRSNAMTLYKNGDLNIAGNFSMGGKTMYGHRMYIDSLYLTPASGFGSLIRGIPLISLKERNYSGLPYVPYSKEFKLTVSGKTFYISDETSGRMVIDNIGNMGIGTISPIARLEVGGTEATPQESAIMNTRANYPQFILRATSGASNAKVWRLVGRSSNTFEIQTLNDSYGGEVTGMQLVRSGTAISSINFPNGNMAIGHSSPAYKLDVNGSSYFRSPVGIQTTPNAYDVPLSISSTSTNRTAILLSNTTQTQSYIVQMVGSGVAGRLGNFEIWANNPGFPAISVTPTGYTGIFTSTPGSTYRLYVNGATYSTGGYASSDVRWKKEIEQVETSIEKILKLRAVSFNWRTEEFPSMDFDNSRQLGLIAQDVEAVFPELVKTDDQGYKAVSYEKLSVLLLEGMRNQQVEIEETKKENELLKSELQLLKEQLTSIESRLQNIR